MVVSGSIFLGGGATVNVNSGAQLQLNGAIRGTGQLIKTGTGTLVLGGSDNNTYSDGTVVSQGTLLLNKTVGRHSRPVWLEVGSSAIRAQS